MFYNKINANKRFGKKGWSLRRGKRTFPCILLSHSRSSSLWREWVLQLVGAKGEELLLDKCKSYATVTGVVFSVDHEKNAEDAVCDPFPIKKIVFEVIRIFRYRALHKRS